jgi:hypothetical protein
LFFYLKILDNGFSNGLTVCVTRAGAGGGMPSDWENADA